VAPQAFLTRPLALSVQLSAPAPQLGMQAVPVGVGTDGGSDTHTAHFLESAPYATPIHSERMHSIEPGRALLHRQLTMAEDKSTVLLCISSLKDAALLIRDNPRLCADKLKSIVVMGGLDLEACKSSGTLVPDTAHNNMFDISAASFLHRTCASLALPMTVVSRFAAYATPVPREIYDRLAQSGSPIGWRLRKAQRDSIERLWKRALAPPWSAEREGLPERCDKAWFSDTFCAGRAMSRGENDPVWDLVVSFNLYDVVALMAAIPSLATQLFKPTLLCVSAAVPTEARRASSRTAPAEARSSWAVFERGGGAGASGGGGGFQTSQARAAKAKTSRSLSLGSSTTSRTPSSVSCASRGGRSLSSWRGVSARGSSRVSVVSVAESATAARTGAVEEGSAWATDQGTARARQSSAVHLLIGESRAVSGVEDVRKAGAFMSHCISHGIGMAVEARWREQVVVVLDEHPGSVGEMVPTMLALRSLLEFNAVVCASILVIRGAGHPPRPPERPAPVQRRGSNRSLSTTSGAAEVASALGVKSSGGIVVADEAQGDAAMAKVVSVFENLPADGVRIVLPTGCPALLARFAHKHPKLFREKSAQVVSVGAWNAPGADSPRAPPSPPALAVVRSPVSSYRTARIARHHDTEHSASPAPRARGDWPSAADPDVASASCASAHRTLRRGLQTCVDSPMSLPRSMTAGSLAGSPCSRRSDRSVASSSHPRLADLPFTLTSPPHAHVPSPLGPGESLAHECASLGVPVLTAPWDLARECALPRDVVDALPRVAGALGQVLLDMVSERVEAVVKSAPSRQQGEAILGGGGGQVSSTVHASEVVCTDFGIGVATGHAETGPRPSAAGPWDSSASGSAVWEHVSRVPVAGPLLLLAVAQSQRHESFLAVGREFEVLGTSHRELRRDPESPASEVMKALSHLLLKAATLDTHVLDDPNSAPAWMAGGTDHHTEVGVHCQLVGWVPLVDTVPAWLERTAARPELRSARSSTQTLLPSETRVSASAGPEAIVPDGGNGESSRASDEAGRRWMSAWMSSSFSRRRAPAPVAPAGAGDGDAEHGSSVPARSSALHTDNVAWQVDAMTQDRVLTEAIIDTAHAWLMNTAGRRRAGGDAGHELLHIGG